MNATNTEFQPTDPAFKGWVKGLLHDDNVSNLCITFVKVDGEPRTIRCTTSESKIPTDKLPKGTSHRTPTDANQRVFDLDKQEWRSFRWEAVKEVKFEIVPTLNPPEQYRDDLMTNWEDTLKSNIPD